MITSKNQVSISIFGLGYVGVVCAACFAKMGYRVTGVDIQQHRVDLVNEGKSPIVENNLAELISHGVSCGRLVATLNAHEAVQHSNLSMVCIGTPSRPDGEVNLGFIENVCKEIGEAIRIKDTFHVIVIRSTIPPGTTRKAIIPTIEAASQKVAGVDFGIAVNPEFLRESTAVEDFLNPPIIVVGELDSKSGEIVASLYSNFTAPIFRTTIEIAEMIKYANNTWHALKVCFANEIGSICKELGIDSYQLMHIFCQDTKLNLSSYYLRPGFPFGGSCLPKDVRAIRELGRKLKLDIPLINAILPSNTAHIERALQIIRSHRPKRIGFLGVTFKHGTDDVRESPALILIGALINDGVNICIHDENLLLLNLMGENKKFLERYLPNFEQYLYDNAFELSKDVDMFVVTHNSKMYSEIIQNRFKNQVVIDFVRLELPDEAKTNYYGFCW